MKKKISVVAIGIVLFLTVSVMAQNKVVVIPMESKSTTTFSQTPKLACVTGEYGRVYPSNGEILISNSQNITVNSPDEVFHTWQSAPEFVDDIRWALLCNDGWINTGCSGAGGTSAPFDISQRDNGCYSGDDEYNNMKLFTTCCKIIF